MIVEFTFLLTLPAYYFIHLAIVFGQTKRDGSALALPAAEQHMNNFERRKNIRFKAAQGAYAVLGPETSKLGQIKDISMGGLAFKYLADEARSNGAGELDIIIRQNCLCVKNIPVQTVSDFELARENAFSTVRLRQQGVQFVELTSDQTSQLEFILKHHTSWIEEPS